MAEATLQLVVGLGNPGPQYERTRHNAGFWLADELARRHGGAFRLDARFHGEVCRVVVADQNLWLLKPMAYMNRSGQAVSRLAGFYKISPPAILVLHDDLDLPVGTVRLKRAGGHGGHNGLRDILAQLGSADFLRVRLGIGHPGDSRDVTNYVLGRATSEEQQALDQAVIAAAREFPRLVEGQLDKVMQALHSRPVPAVHAALAETRRNAG